MAIANERGEPLRVALRLTGPQLAALPWEALFDSEIGAYICRTEQLVRHVPAPYTPDPLEVVPPLRILGLVASPQGTSELDVTAEQERLTSALAGPIGEGLIVLEWLAQASWDAVQEKLLSAPWHVLHFIGHGDYDVNTDQGLIMLVGGDGGPNLVESGRLTDLLNEADPTPRLVVLNSCSSGEEGTRDLFSGTAAALVRSGISAVAAMQFTVSDDAAISFARGFYTALGHGHGIDQATRSGRIAMLGVPNTLEWVTPVLYVRGTTADLFTLTPPPSDDAMSRNIAATQGNSRGPALQGAAHDNAPADVEGVTTAKGRRRWLTREKLVIGIIVPVLAAVLAVVLPHWLDRPTAKLQVVATEVVPGDNRPVGSPDSGEWEMVPPKIRISVSNIGDQVAVVTGARFEVLDYAYLPICQGGGALEVSQTYDLLLPDDPKLGEVFPVDVSQEIEPNHADRFEFAVQNPDPDLATHLYRLGISLVRDGGSGTVDAGVVVVAAPFLNAGPLSRDVLTYPGDVGECYRRLTAEYERAESWAGKKTPEFSQPLFGER